MSRGEIILRYIVYSGCLFFLSTVIMSVMKDDNTSFWEKLTNSPGFALKYICLQAAITMGIAVSEWLIFARRITDSLNKDKWSKVFSVLRKYIAPAFIYILALSVVFLNGRLMFDNVVWGDEAFSANTAKKSMFGIMQVLYFWDKHPPLHYYWIKLFGELFGHTVSVYHLASLVPFFGGIVLAVTLFRKHFGNLPAALFIVISGLASTCIEYNLEIRMYSLAFFGVLCACYCSYRVIGTGKRYAWVCLVLWALVAAYSHYYALVAAGILLFCTGVAFWLKYRGRTWQKGLGAIAAFIVGYAPWLFFLFTAMKGVNDSWWMTDIPGLDISLKMVMGGNGFSVFILPLFILLIAVLILAESSVFCVEKKDGQEIIRLGKPSVKGWSDEIYSVIVGLFTIIGTLLFAYLLCVLMGPVLAQRYLYPLSAVAFFTLVVGSGHALTLLKKLGERIRISGTETIGKIVLTAFLAVLLIVGLGNYREYSTLAWEQNAKTKEVLDLIGEPDEEVQMVTNGVKHLGWTVLYHYFPDNEIINGNYDCATSDEFWYFNPVPMNDTEISYLNQNGFKVTSYGEMQISKYLFELYYIKRT